MNERTTWTAFSSLRWVGIALFVVAIPLFALGLAALLAGRAGIGTALPGVAALGLSLGAFGTANDTALAAARNLARAGQAPAVAAAELDTEARKRAARLATLHASPKAAVIIPILVVALQAYLWPRVLGAWGLAGGWLGGQAG
ncbi:MAG: hypothetical protein FJ102_18505 [Deltaproteobacteria bacterium]|nr:hypothetical protein [Deltaproteobacteria bacterium]